jgi:hypothetical protein
MYSSTSWEKRVGVRNFKGHDALVASILDKKGAISLYNQAAYTYIGEVGSETESLGIPTAAQSFATADEAAEALIMENDPFVTTVVKKYDVVVTANDGTKGQGTLLGNRDHSHIV